MFSINFLFVAFIASLFCSKVLGEDEYPTPDIDLDDILKNDRLMQGFLDCLMDRGPCTKEGEELKEDIPEALATGCEKCNGEHKEAIKKVVKYLQENKEEWWKELKEKYDPSGEYAEKYAELLDD